MHTLNLFADYTRCSKKECHSKNTFFKWNTLYTIANWILSIINQYVLGFPTPKIKCIWIFFFWKFSCRQFWNSFNKNFYICTRMSLYMGLLFVLKRWTLLYTACPQLPCHSNIFKLSEVISLTEYSVYTEIYSAYLFIPNNSSMNTF